MRYAARLLPFLLVAAVPFAQADFTAADLAGPYAFSAHNLGGDGPEPGTAMGASVTVLGALTADGAGNVTGTRTLLREERSGSQFTTLTMEPLEQSFEGTYTVTPDGRGVLTITPTPNTDWHYLPHWNGHAESTETWAFVLQDGGRSLRLQARLRHEVELPYGTPPWRWDVALTGRADSQEPVPSDVPSARDLARVEAQLCEVLRLLTTPEALRPAEASRVLDGCSGERAETLRSLDAPRGR